MSKSATDVACPRCSASTGAPCTRDGVPLRRPHWERFGAARTDPEVRDRGGWSSPTQAQRVSKKRTVTLPPDLNEAADALVEDDECLSEVVARSMRRDPLVARYLERLAAERAKKSDTA